MKDSFVKSTTSDKIYVMKKFEQLIERAYAGFNSRDIDSVLLVMDKNVDWPNGWEGGYVHGHEEVRAYWTRQWKELNPMVEPVSIEQRSEGQVEVKVHQLVKDMEGKLIADGMVKHVYTIGDNLIRRMEIEAV